MTTKSIRLNKEMREKIINNIKQAYIKNNPEPIEPALSALDVLRDHAIKEYLKIYQPLIDLINQHPYYMQKTVDYDSSFKIRLPSGCIEYIYFTEKGDVSYPYCNAVVVDYSVETKTNTKINDQYNSVRKQWRDYDGNAKQYATKLAAYLDDTRQVIYGVNTTSQLVSAWAEVERFIPAGYCDPSAIQLPAVSIAHLNSKLK